MLGVIGGVTGGVRQGWQGGEWCEMAFWFRGSFGLPSLQRLGHRTLGTWADAVEHARVEWLRGCCVLAVGVREGNQVTFLLWCHCGSFVLSALRCGDGGALNGTIMWRLIRWVKALIGSKLQHRLQVLGVAPGDSSIARHRQGFGRCDNEQ